MLLNAFMQLAVQPIEADSLSHTDFFAVSIGALFASMHRSLKRTPRPTLLYTSP
jgi:hypothetical protein